MEAKVTQRGSRETIARMRKDLDKVKLGVTKAHQNLVKAMFRDLVATTPQWSGELAMHWGIEVHGAKAPPAYSLHSAYNAKSYTDRLAAIPYQMGSEPAVSATIARELVKIDQIRYNSIVKFVNNMPYAEDVQRGEGPNGKPIREENRLAAYGGVAMISYIDMKYKSLRTAKKAAGL